MSKRNNQYTFGENGEPIDPIDGLGDNDAGESQNHEEMMCDVSIVEAIFTELAEIWLEKNAMAILTNTFEKKKANKKSGSDFSFKSGGRDRY